MLFKQFEMVIPVFFACLGALIINASVMMNNAIPQAEVFPEFAEEMPVETESIHFFTQIQEDHHDFILEMYRDLKTQGRVHDFFTGICASPEIAEVILYNANLFDISPALAVALAWEESRLNPAAVNDQNTNKSIDRGLFQLNNQSFPRLEIQSFFSPETNAWYAMNHLRYCIETGGSEVAALAMYNAGPNRVNTAGTPKSTLNYISRILDNRREIENRFREQDALYQEPEPEPLPEIAEAEPERSRLPPLMPLAR